MTTNLYENEIVRLHDFFVAWFTAELPNTAAAFTQFSGAMASDFCIISPSGTASSYSEITANLRNAHGRMPHIRIWIENVTIQQQHGNITIATYEEWQERAGNATSRLSTVIFKEDEQAPHRLRWLHVHETWFTPTQA